MPINESGVDFISLNSLISLDGETNSTSLVNLGVLTQQNSGSFQDIALLNAVSDDNKLQVGEAFVLRTTNTSTGNSQLSGLLTTLGTGSFSTLLTGTQEIIVAQNSAGQQFIVFPNGDAPSGLLGGLGTLLVTNITAEPIGYNFDTGAPICFARGTMIEIEEGLCAIENLKVGDFVLTKDNGAQEIRWIGRRHISSTSLQRRSYLRPIRICAGSLGPNTPSTDLVVSPQHRILVRSKIAQKMFGTDEVLVAAKQLLRIDGIDICDDDENGVEYFHILLSNHEVIFANGAESESLFTGPEAIKSVGTAALAEISEIFPEILKEDHEAIGARLLTSGRLGRKLASRHAQNAKYLVN